MKQRSPQTQTADPPQRFPARPVYPFATIVGQDEMKLALLLNVIDPSIGGVLMMGHRGTGKSTIVRALADLLPRIAKVRGCLYGCDPLDLSNCCDDCAKRSDAGSKLPSESATVPVVDLPLGATEDRVCGAINFERALTAGVKAFEPGLLARANRGFLYIDEVNLLEDHLIDILLDVAVTGRNSVEREGISLEHPSRFVLIGSGNPEEGELRPQLIDRFGLCVEVRTESDLDLRVAIIERRDAFERDPANFLKAVEGEQENLRRRLVRARKKVGEVKLSRELLRRIAELCVELKIDGHRGELTISRAARALAAFEGRREASARDVRRVSVMALQHRLRRDPLDQPAGGGARIEDALEKLFPPDASATEADDTTRAHDTDKVMPRNYSGGGAGEGGTETNVPGRNKPPNIDGAGDDGASHQSPPGVEARMAIDSFDLSSPVNRQKKDSPSRPGRNQKSVRASSTSSRRGRYMRAAVTPIAGAKVALDATLRAAASSHHPQSATLGPASLKIDAQAIRYKQYKRKLGTLFIFAVDASGSMALNRIGQAKGVMTRLLQKSYVNRDLVALVSFRGRDAEVLLPPCKSVTRAKNILDALHLGGPTPLSAGLVRSLEVARRARRDGARRIVLLLFTDGRANVSLRGDEISDAAARGRVINQEIEKIGAALVQTGVTTMVVDTQNKFTSSGEGRLLAGKLKSRYKSLSPTGTASASLLSHELRA